VKKRVYEAAHEFEVSVKELLADLKELGIEKRGNLSVLEEAEFEQIRTFYHKKDKRAPSKNAMKSAVTAAPAKAPPKAPVPKPTARPRRKQVETKATPEVTPGEPAAPVAVTETETAKPPEMTQPERTVVEAPAKPPKTKPTGQPRPPVVTVLGHVDHGKTTLLDKIRRTHVAEGEVGGITQSTGAYQVEHHGHKITFIDTPGHRAFAGMRARGAQVTDIAILVVAADDGIMEQTREALAHARAAQVPIIVAINKIDKPGVDLNRVQKQLHDEGLTPEDWGGQTITVPISALTGEGIDGLLEMILLVAELAELRADPHRPAQGTIIESHLDPARGPVTSAILKDGTLRERDVVVAGTAYGRIRALLDDRGKRIVEALPGSPVQILGLSQVPPVGVPLEVVEGTSVARQLVESRKEEERRARLQRGRRTWEDVLARTAEQFGLLKLIVKADTIGSLEALQSELQGIAVHGAKLEFVFTGVGNISESDVLLAASAEGEIGVLGFRVHVDPKAKELADQEQITVRTYDVIYQLTDDIRKALKGLIEPEYEEVKLGEIEVRNVFKIPKIGVVAGGFVREGHVTRNAQVRVLRNGSLVYQGKIQSLRRFDQDVREVAKDKECGIKIEGFEDVRIGDRLEAFTVRQLEPL
jgi:translation initiation factor IF-2